MIENRIEAIQSTIESAPEHSGRPEGRAVTVGGGAEIRGQKTR